MVATEAISRWASMSNCWDCISVDLRVALNSSICEETCVNIPIVVSNPVCKYSPSLLKYGYFTPRKTCVGLYVICDSRLLKTIKTGPKPKARVVQADRALPLRPKLIMMSASPSMMRVISSGVTSLHTLKALKNASLMTSSSRSGEYPRILRGLRASHREGRGVRTFYLTLRRITEPLEH